MYSCPTISSFSVNQFCLHNMKQLLFVLNMHSCHAGIAVQYVARVLHFSASSLLLFSFHQSIFTGLVITNYVVSFLSNFVFLYLSYKNGSMVRQEIRDKYANGDWKVL